MLLKTRFIAPLIVAGVGIVVSSLAELHAAGPVAQPADGSPVKMGRAASPLGQVATTHVIVRVRPGIEPRQVQQGRWTFDAQDGAALQHFPDPAAQERLSRASLQVGAVLEERSVTRVASALTTQPLHEELATELGLDRYYRVEVPAGTDTPALAEELRSWQELFEEVEIDGLGGVATPPNDPEFPLQFGLHNTGQPIQGVPGVPGADINALAAWSITTGCDDIVIAVLDSGVQQHVDLAGRLLPGFNVNTQDSETNPINDCSSHGTHVAGIIAANVNNSTGVAGVTWKSSILPVVVLNGCFGNQIDLAEGVIWAANAGADIINMSLQYGPPGSTLLHNAVQYAYGLGIVLVAAAGNDNSFNVCDGTTCVAFPARWPEVIAVAATTNQDQIWSGSNAGPEVSVSAAGFRVRSLTGTSTTGYKNGTSFAAPHASGAAALVLSLDPDLSPDEVRLILEATADDLGTPGHDHDFGHGRINAHAAILGTVGPITGDFNGDCSVGVFDLLELLGQWGPCSGCSPEECPADLDGDCSVTVFDLLQLLGNWGPKCFPCAR